MEGSVVKKEQVVALSDANERLIYATVSEDARGVAKAKAELRLAKEMSSGPPNEHVLARMKASDPVGAAAAGLIDFSELQDLVSENPTAYLDAEEARVVRENPSNLRVVVAARRDGVSLNEVMNKPMRDRADFALAARGDRRGAAALVDFLQRKLRK